MFDIAMHQQVIAAICRELRVKRLDLVGSAARPDFHPERSDIDLIAEFDGTDRLFDRYFELKNRFEEQFGRRVDIIQYRAIKNPFVRESLDHNRVLVYGA